MSKKMITDPNRTKSLLSAQHLVFVPHLLPYMVGRLKDYRAGIGTKKENLACLVFL